MRRQAATGGQVSGPACSTSVNHLLSTHRLNGTVELWRAACLQQVATTPKLASWLCLHVAAMLAAQVGCQSPAQHHTRLAFTEIEESNLAVMLQVMSHWNFGMCSQRVPHQRSPQGSLGSPACRSDDSAHHLLEA